MFKCVGFTHVYSKKCECKHQAKPRGGLYSCLFQVSHLKDFIPQAFPYGHDMILDSEILMIDLKTGQPLPFGSLGKHKVR